MTTLQQAQAACDVVDAYLREQAGHPPTQPPTHPPTEPPANPPTQPPAGVTEIALDWANPQRVYTNATNIALVFTTGSTDTQGQTCGIAGAEYNDAPSDMYAVLAEVSGDFDNPIGPVMGPSKSMTARFYVGSPGVYYPTLKKNTRHCVNVKNEEGRNKFFDLSRGNFT